MTSTSNSPKTIRPLNLSPSSPISIGIPSPLAVSVKKPNPRRQSSISYISSNDVTQLSSTNKPVFAVDSGSSSRSSLSRSASLGQRSPLSTGFYGRKSAIREKERPPLTPAEKHAELLHIIAQKESICLELRSQLALHEAELLQLKRKWEVIVSRGLDTPLTYDLITSPNLSGQSKTSPSNAIVLEGIKEGMQGVGKLLLGHSLSSPTSGSSTKPAIQHGESSRPSKPPRSRPMQLRDADSVTIHSSDSGTERGISSDRTSITSSASGTSIGTSAMSHRTSQTSLSESTSKRGCEEVAEDVSEDEVQVLMVHDTGATPTVSPNPAFGHQIRRTKERDSKGNNSLQCKYGDLDKGRQTKAQHRQTLPPGALTVTLDGAGEEHAFFGSSSTGDRRSGNGERWLRRRSAGWSRYSDESDGGVESALRNLNGAARTQVDAETPHTTSSDAVSSAIDSPCMGDSVLAFGSTGINPSLDLSHDSKSDKAASYQHNMKKSNSRQSQSQRPSASFLPPASSIPGLSSLAAAGVAMSGVESLGRKWEELTKGAGIAKGQKRASLLLSDLVSALVPSGPSTSPSTPAAIPPSAPLLSRLLPTSSPTSTTSSATNLSPNHTISAPLSAPPSLLDDSDDDERQERISCAMAMATPTPMLRPREQSKGTKENLNASTAKKAQNEEDEEWNW